MNCVKMLFPENELCENVVSIKMNCVKMLFLENELCENVVSRK